MAKATTPATSFTWNIAQLERLCQTGEIQTVHYTVEARTGDNAYNTSAYGSIGLEPAEPESMVPFSDVTQELVVGWVKSHFGDEKVAEIETALENALTEMREPTKAAGLPWAS